MALHTITVKIVAGELVVDPGSLEALEGDTLEWKSGTGIQNFVVSFCASNRTDGRKPRTPLLKEPDKADEQFEVRMGDVAKTVSAKAGGKPPWKYQYAVAATDENGTLYALDPEIRIRPI